MPFVTDQDGLSVAALAALVARSPIVTAAPDRLASQFLVGFEDVDIAVLRWIAGERARVGAISVM
jgi:hypothetical protein